MRDREVQELQNNLLFDLDTIRIEQTSLMNLRSLT